MYNSYFVQEIDPPPKKKERGKNHNHNKQLTDPIFQGPFALIQFFLGEGGGGG